MIPPAQQTYHTDHLMALHLRQEHGWGWKRIAKRLNRPEADVRRMFLDEADR